MSSSVRVTAELLSSLPAPAPAPRYELGEAEVLSMVVVAVLPGCLSCSGDSTSVCETGRFSGVELRRERRVWAEVVLLVTACTLTSLPTPAPPLLEMVTPLPLWGSRNW